tara:strand:+ start:63 stop:1154 length:1092 start_codon:yes stop_codon:yes gene_type:complete
MFSPRQTYNDNLKLAFVTGIGGQDGSYLSELLIEKGYKVYGIVRRNSTLYNDKNIAHLRGKINIRYGDVNDALGLNRYLSDIISENEGFSVFEMYNLAAQSHVAVSFEIPDYTNQTNVNGALYILEFMRNQPKNIQKRLKFYQASTSEMYGDVLEPIQSETTPFNPLSPYACAKVNAFYLTKCYRESYGLFSCNGILFNHESPRRGNNFVTKKIVLGIKDYVSRRDSMTKEDDAPLILGNVFSYRDWGHAKDYVNGMWLILQNEKSTDFVLSTNESIMVKDFVEMVCDEMNIRLRWTNENSEYNIRAYDADTGLLVMRTDKKYFRDNDVVALRGNSDKAREMLGWTPVHNINTLVTDMVNASD